METAVKVLDQIQKAAKINKADDRMVKTWKPGEWVRQGDVYLTCVSEDWPHGKEIKDHQLAPGTSKGSRHFADTGIKVYEGKKIPEGLAERMGQAFGLSADRIGQAVMGPVLEITKRANVTHPEHGDYSLPGGCWAQVTYQMDSKSLQRVRD